MDEAIRWHVRGKYIWVVPDCPDRMGHFGISVSSDGSIPGHTSSAGKVQPWESIPFI